MWPKVNKDLLPMKGHYFLNNAGMAPVQPFMPIYANSLGFSSSVVGTIYFILPITGMLAKPFFGGIADRFRLHKFLFLLFQIVTIISFFSIQFIPEIPSDNYAKVNLVCGAETNFHVNISQIEDKSAVERLTDDPGSNEVVHCQMQCNLSPAFQNEICYHWKGKIPTCVSGTTLTNMKNVITESPSIGGKKSKLLEVGKDMYAEKFRSVVSTDPVLNFNATISMKHTVQLENTLYFRVSTVLLENDTTHIPYCLQEIDTVCNITCERSGLANLLTDKHKREMQPSGAVHYYQFWLLLFLLITSWAGMGVVGSISDAICFEILGAKGSQYGKQRLWGSVGWGVFAFLAGVAIDYFSQGSTKKNFTPIFYMMLIMLSCDVACMYSLKYHQTKLSTKIIRNVGQLLTSVKVDLFLIWCIFVGICIGVQWNFLYWYVGDLSNAQPGGAENEKWTKTLQGSLGAIQCFLGELPSFLVSGWLLKKFGHINVMSGILLFIGIRFVLYSCLTNPWWCLPIEILQSTVGLSFATMASYASIVAPPGTEATVQGLVGATFEGIGVSLGSFLGGYFYQEYGGASCFRYFGLGALVAFVLHSGIQYLFSRTTGFKLNGKDFNGVAKYASPNEAVSMLDDT